MALLACMTTQARAELVSDTLVIEDVNKVRIETRDTVQRIVINGSKDDSQFHYVQRISIPDTSAVRRSVKSVKDFNKIVIKDKDGKPSKWESSVSAFVGLNTLLSTPKEYDFKLWPSLEIGFNVLADYRPFGKKNVWSIGLSFDWRSYGYDNDQYLDKVNNMLIPRNFSKPQENTSSSLVVTSIGIPLMYTHYFDKKQKLGLTLGAVVNWNCYVRANRNYEEGDTEYEASVKKIGEHPITIDGIVIAHIPSFPELYCKYSPIKLFKDGRGPEANQLSFGLYF